MLKYFFVHFIWLLSLSVQLVRAMGTGAEWIIRAIRMLCFILLVARYFMGHWWWYITSPNIIRGVAYRSSPSVKRQNILKVIGEEKRGHRESTQRRISLGGLFHRKGGEESSAHVTDNMGEDAVDQEIMQCASLNINPADGSRIDGIPCSSSAELLDAISELLHEGHNSSSGEFTLSAAEDLNLQARAQLDIILPVPLDSLLQSLSYARSNAKFGRKKFPIVISLNGGAWIIGSHLWSSLIGRLLAARGYLVFCPDYRNFPQTDMEGMVLDVSDAIRWVLRNAERYNGDLEDVTLIGQSAGAHLTMMSLLSQAQLHAQAAGGGPPPSNMAYNVPRYNPRLSIHRYIGLSGIYNVRGLVTHFHRRGLYRKVLYEMAGGRANLPRYSLNSYFEERRSGDTGEVLPNNIFDFFPRRMFFIHGDADCSAPVSESANLAFVMRNAQRDRMLSRIASKERLSMLSGTHLSLSADNSAIVRNGGPPSASATVEMGAVPEGKLPSLYLAERSALSNVDSTDLVDIEWLMIPDASHTDPIVEEILLEGRSCCVEFLCDYEVRTSGSKRSGKKVLSQPAGSTMEEEDAAVVASVPPPDAILPLCVPYERRPWLMRLATWGFRKGTRGGMDVDSVIARHRARLDEHRKYLDSSTAGTGGFLTSPDANSSSLLQTTTVHVADESVSSPLPVKPINEARVPSSFSSPPVLTTQKHDGESGNRDDLQRCRSADDTKEEKRMQRRRELYINQTLALQAADAAYRKREAQQHRSSEGPAADDGKSNDTNESRRACSGPVAFYGYTSTQERLDEESRFFGRQLKAAGRYYVSRPDAMYTKTKLWLEGRDRSLQQLKHERMLNTLNECSFNPRLSTPPSDPRRARSMRATSYFRDDPGVAAHLERLDEARQQRVEAERRLRGKEAGTWQNRLTVPKEFEFARRVTAIPSLRRPFVSAVPLHDDNGVGDEEEGAHENNAHAGAQQGSERGAAPPAECQPEKAEDMPSIRVPGGVHEKDEGVATTTAAVDASVDDDAATPTTAAMPPQLKVVVARLEEQLAEKDQMLQQQKGEIASLRRQLEVVRATVRRLSLQDVAPGEAGR